MEDGSIDAGLDLLCAVTPRGVVRTLDEIAHACGCSRGNIWLLEQSALKKLRRQFVKRGIAPSVKRPRAPRSTNDGNQAGGREGHLDD